MRRARPTIGAKAVDATSFAQIRSMMTTGISRVVRPWYSA
jgi:hypothetical protein